jgi:dTDP-4-amino-4,6-dideoxygalactose transaminase
MRSFIHLAQPLFGEEEKKEVLAALDSGWVTLGPRTKQFEEDFAKYVGAKYAVAVSSCTAGLYLALLAAGIGEGDEVITTVLTFAATANTIIHTGARPVFIDVDPKTLNIDPALIEKKITKKTCNWKLVINNQ